MAALLLLGACDRVQAPTAEEPSPAFDFTNGPPTPGPFVVRIAGQRVFFFNADENSGLLSLHFPSDIFLCGGGAIQNLADAEFVVTPSEKVTALIEDEDGAVSIYGTADLSEAFGPGGFLSDIPLFCSFLNGPKKIAEGTARRVSVFSGQSFSASWTGTLTETGGNPVRYTEHLTFRIDPQTGAQTDVTSSIGLH
jgi:hypothetical protein